MAQHVSDSCLRSNRDCRHGIRRRLGGSAGVGVLNSSSLEQMAAKARCEPKLRFTSFAQPSSGGICHEIPKWSAAGVDGQTVEAAKKSFDEWIEPMLQSIHRQGYKAPDISAGPLIVRSIGRLCANGSPQRLRKNLARRPTCPKLKTYWHFYNCRYEKTNRTCIRRRYCATALAEQENCGLGYRCDHLQRPPYPRSGLRSPRPQTCFGRQQNDH